MNYVVRDPFGSVAQPLFRSTGVNGIYGRTALFERVVDGLSGLISRYRAHNAEVLRFPPVINRAHIEKAGYLHSFPHLLGAVSCLHGDEAEIRAAVDRPSNEGGWTAALKATDLVLTPAACYHVYPLVAARGRVPAGGVVFDVACDCFRHEPSQHVDRLQSFRMREYVCLASPRQAADFRDRWMQQGQEIADQLDLRHAIAPARRWTPWRRSGPRLRSRGSCTIQSSSRAPQSATRTHPGARGGSSREPRVCSRRLRRQLAKATLSCGSGS